MRHNVAQRFHAETHEGGTAGRQTPTQELTRAVATCLLWEPTFYEKGDDIAARIADLCKAVPVETVASLAVQAREDWKLRHVPLWLCVQLAALARGRGDGLTRSTLARVIQRPDELGEFLSLYWRDGKRPLSGQIKKGLAAALGKFDAYRLAKWNRDAAVKLRDVLFLCHAKPMDAEQDALWKQLIDGTLAPADTWEVALSAGADKRETWTRLLAEKKLGYMALLQNLRNMIQAGVEPPLVAGALQAGATRSKALPFRFVAAARHAPQFAQDLSDAMVLALGDAPKLAGTTVLVVDVSGSMDDKLAGKSELSRLDAAGALAVLLREVCASIRVFTFSTMLAEVPNLRGLGLIDAIVHSQAHGGTYLAQALNTVRVQAPKADRIIVVTDEQSHDGTVQPWAPSATIINVAPYKPGLDTSGGWNRISGWSERIVDWLQIAEADAAG